MKRMNYTFNAPKNKGLRSSFGFYKLYKANYIGYIIYFKRPLLYHLIFLPKPIKDHRILVKE